MIKNENKAKSKTQEWKIEEENIGQEQSKEDTKS